MITKIAASLGLATTLVGTWVFTRGHAAQSVCNSLSSPSKGGVASTVCLKAVSTYLIGVTLTTGGLIILTLILFAMFKQSRNKEWSQMSFTVAGQPHRSIGRANASKPLVKTGS